jgi:MMPL family
VLNRAVARACGADPQSVACLRARRALAAAQSDLAAAQRALAAEKAQMGSLRRQAVVLGRQAAQLARQAAALARQAARLARQAAPLLRQARALAAQAAALQRQANALAALRRQADQLRAEGASLQRQADALQKQADDLKKQQQQAEEEKKQTEQLKQELTDMLTKAGGDDRGTDPRLVKLQGALATPADVQLVSPPSINKGGDAATFTVIPKIRPADPKTADLVGEMRTSVVPSATAEGGITANVGGVTAANVDLASKISSQLAELILVVLALSIVLLLVAFRSLLIPLQAAVTNLLCVGAAFGVLVATFQWGWGLDLVGLSTPYGTVPIASYVPLMMFAALFGLSMDYEVFLVSQIAQHPRRRRAAPAGRPLRRRLQRQGDRGRGDHHDLGVRQLRPQRRPDHQAVRGRPVGGGAAGQRHGPVAGPGHADAVRRRRLVAPRLAGPAAPTRQHRGGVGSAAPTSRPSAPTPSRDRRLAQAVHPDPRDDTPHKRYGRVERVPDE